jgi:hypothetical protein
MSGQIRWYRLDVMSGSLKVLFKDFLFSNKKRRDTQAQGLGRTSF